MSVEIRPATGEEILAFYAQRLLLHHVAVVDGEPVAMAGVARDGDELWAFLDVGEHAKAAGAAIIIAMRRKLKELKQTVFVQCENEQAERLLAAIGFAPTQRMRGKLRVWTYHG
jgi:hypothetical protein